MVDGAMTLVSDSYTSSHSEKFLDDVHELIRDAMNAGNFNKVHPAITKISYWNRKTSAITAAESPSERNAERTILPVYFCTFIGIGVAGFIVFFGLLSWRRQRRKKKGGRNSIGSIDSDSNSTLSSQQSDTHSGIVLVIQTENTVAEKSDSHLDIVHFIEAGARLPAGSCSLCEAQSYAQLSGIRPADSFEFVYLPRSLSPELATAENS